LTAEGSPPPSAPGFQSNLTRRVATALVALPSLLAVVFLAPPVAGWVLVAAAMLVGLHEYYGLIRARQMRPVALPGLLLGAALFVEIGYPGGLDLGWIPLAALPALSAPLARRDFSEAVPAAALTVLGSLYLGALGGCIAGLLVIEPLAEGPWRLVMLLATIMASDTFAFFVGHALGRRRLAPLISPGKTVEGALGGLVGGIVGALAVAVPAFPDLAWPHAVVLGAAVAVAGVAGDLFESVLKRWAGVKDSGRLFPGHGGMLDRLDSLLFGAPILYYYFQYLR
jgi:phosphatidate cytidylyltransferase